MLVLQEIADSLGMNKIHSTKFEAQSPQHMIGISKISVTILFITVALLSLFKLIRKG